MRVLIDECLNLRLGRALTGHCAVARIETRADRKSEAMSIRR